MREKQVNAAAIVCFTCAGLLFVLYVGGYFLLSDCRISMSLYTWKVRRFPTPWLAVIYRPAAAIEGFCQGCVVSAEYWPDESTPAQFLSPASH